MTARCVMLVAAEPSGDLLGADLARAIRARLGAEGVRFVGVGGERMAAGGLESPFAIADLSIVGVFDALLALPRVLRRVRETANLASREGAEMAVLIDAWGFNVRLARRLRRLNPRPILVKYVVPQVWASRPWRAREIARIFDHLLAINIFDAAIFERYGAKITFVGNPALARDFFSVDPSRLRSKIGAESGEPILLVLPGSRPSEVRRLIQPFKEAVSLLTADRPALHVVVAAAPSVAEEVKAGIIGWPGRIHLIEGDEARFDAMVGATAALACSGTVTTELALAGCPMVVAYRVDWPSYQIGRRLVTIRFLTLFNLAADRAVAPELIQSDCNGPALARAIGALLDNSELRAAQVVQQREAVARLGGGVADPIGAAADAIIAALPPS
ncbi:MAG TPA: lipid-A-disaccharide synthase [Caulobacteraceae bacterium]